MSQSVQVRVFVRPLAGLIFATTVAFLSTPSNAAECGKASWYKMGKVTASGEPMDVNAMAAAHRTLPFGTKVRVENLANNRSIVVRINDRGPFIRGRVIDVTQGAARRLDMIGSGVAPVRVTVLDGDAKGASVRQCG